MAHMGTVKWFNRAKSFGFITTDEGEDVFVHASDVAADELHELDAVAFNVAVEDSGRLRAIDVRVVREDSSPRGDQPLAKRSRTLVSPTRGSGNVKWFSAAKGYGYITSRDGTDVFVHGTEVLGDTRLAEDDYVLFRTGVDDAGRECATRVQKIEDGPQSHAVEQSSGVLKFFDTRKGFGFITDDASAEGVFVHESDMKGVPLVEGTAVLYTPGTESDGRARALSVVSAGDRGRGVVAWFDQDRAYGFIESDMGRVFVHQSGLEVPVVFAGDHVAFLQGHDGTRDLAYGVRVVPGGKLAGSCRYFDADKGFGFLDRHDGLAPLFVHRVHLRGRESLLPDEEVRFSVETDPATGKLHATDVLSCQRAGAPALRGVQRGAIKWFDPARGYGFITPDSAKDDVYVHCSDLEHPDLVHEGTVVEFRMGEEDNGRKKAVEVRV